MVTIEDAFSFHSLPFKIPDTQIVQLIPSAKM